MKDLRKRISPDHVSIQVEGEPPASAVETLVDDGKVFAVVPANALSARQLEEAFPALKIPGTSAFEIPTGAVVVRWSGPPDTAVAGLRSAGVELVRNYGVGGIVTPTQRENPLDLADRLSRLDFIKSAKVHTIQMQGRR